MPSYLLKRRLRHVRSIRIDNISPAIRKKSERIVVPFAACFLALETLKREALYVSEVQHTFINNVQFNELPDIQNSISHIVLKVVVRIPEECSLASAMDRDAWLILREYEIDLNKLQAVRLEDQLEGHNVPLFEMSDGLYTLQNQTVMRSTSRDDLYLRHKRNTSRNQVPDSFSFNSALKLNIMIDYKAQVQREIEETSSSLGDAISVNGTQKSWLTECLRKYLQDLGQSVGRKKAHALQLRDELKLDNDQHEKTTASSVDGQSLHEYYGSNYPNLIKVKDRVDSLRLKKLSRLISIFQRTSLFEKKMDFIEYDNACIDVASYEKTKLQLINTERVLAMASKTDVDREFINTCLGYYLLFVQLIATKVFQIPLPYGMDFCGSTSMVGNGCCLHFYDSSAAKHPETQLKAIEYFNKNLVQVIQRWEHHVSPRADDQISQLENH